MHVPTKRSAKRLIGARTRSGMPGCSRICCRSRSGWSTPRGVWCSGRSPLRTCSVTRRRRWSARRPTASSCPRGTGSWPTGSPGRCGRRDRGRDGDVDLSDRGCAGADGCAGHRCGDLRGGAYARCAGGAGGPVHPVPDRSGHARPRPAVPPGQRGAVADRRRPRGRPRRQARDRGRPRRRGAGVGDAAGPGPG